MATGDNVLTAVSVARQCNVIDADKETWLGELSVALDGTKRLTWQSSLSTVAKLCTTLPWRHDDVSCEVALTGEALNHIIKKEDQFVVNSVISKAKVFARMSPDDKALLVESIREVLNEQVGMCGDGANDCCALKTADVGISLSEAEASIAAPFTSSVHNIECVVTLLREGKAALATSV